MAKGAESMGPISYLVVEFPGNRLTGKAFPMLLGLVDAGLIRILDLVFVRKDAGGRIRVVELTDLDHDGDLDMVVFEGASSGLLDESDVTEAGAAVKERMSAAILLFENRWAAPFVGALTESGAELVAAGYVPSIDLEAVLGQVDLAGA